MFRKVVVIKGNSSLIKTATDQIKAPLVVALLQHLFDASDQALACGHGAGKGSAGNRQRNRKQSLRPDLEISKEHLSTVAIQPQNSGGDHCKCKAAHFG